MNLKQARTVVLLEPIRAFAEQLAEAFRSGPPA